MKMILILFLGCTVSAFGQQKNVSFNYTSGLHDLNYCDLVRLVAQDEQRNRVDLLRQKLIEAKKNGQLVKAEIDRLKDENEELRELMQEYIRQIDEENKKNSELDGE